MGSARDERRPGPRPLLTAREIAAQARSLRCLAGHGSVDDLGHPTEPADVLVERIE
jgi:hypothetical protein